MRPTIRRPATLAFLMPATLSALAVVGLLLCAGGAGGCSTLGSPNDPGTMDYLARQAYPEDAQTAPPPDIVAHQTHGRLTLYNRTTRRFAGMQLWLNQQYVAEIPPIEVGNNPPLHLTRFVNGHREPFPVGTLLAPDKSRPILLTELYDPRTDTRYKLTTEPGEVN